MSSLVYPLGPIGSLDVQRFDRTVFDEFEDGSTAARRLWTTKTFKRRFKISHENLTEAEMNKLASFMTARDGRYDTFYYRDNHNRAGNATVRMAGEFPISRGAAKRYSPQIILEQTAPVRELVDVDDITTALVAAGSTDVPLIWWDANRAVTYTHLGTVYGENAVKDRSGNGYDLAWVSSQTKAVGGLVSTSQLYDAYTWANGYYATGAAAGVAGPALGAAAQPAMTILAICYDHGTYAGPMVVGHIGGVSAGSALGLQVTNGTLKPWVGASEVWTAATMPTDAFCSIAATWPVGSNVATSYVNGTSTAAGTNSRSYVQSAGSMFAASDGTKHSYGAQFYLAHVLFFNATLSVAQIKAIHNLFVHQYSSYGMAAV